MAEAATGMDGPQKAAVFLMTVGEGPAAEIMKHLGPREVQKIGVAMAVPSPPPIQIAATPRFSPRRSSALRSVTMIRAPDAPMG